ncbi:MAG: radical SAM protein [Bacteroidales bacterium]|nr:radical SAM protein [Bacteroidales bacterium]
MANILLTQRCVRSCPYCFAKKYMADAPFEETLSWNDLIYLADFLIASGENRVSLLGGEPTLHPHFVEIILYLLERNFHINVFTSGVMTPEIFEDLSNNLTGIHPERLSFVCNVNNPSKSPAAEVKKVEQFLETFGHLTNPGYNIYSPDFDMDFVFDYINRFGLKKFVRLGLAHPYSRKEKCICTGGENAQNG